ncbi:hypothetical protein JVT61DRAFT_1081 [Boletus reticuloceps]|uniref:Uncharacterized protein n=1 Tax=Boletus reticuloceps TaxID=495285 RepID=A0A8I3A9M4_9AGAM|nr:hypothetical protein JVT61DRAFT_1081 [Boletus reticuloceps]
MEIFSDVELPDYSPSIPPDYSSTPLPGEQCIQRTPKQTTRYRENCAFTYEEHGMSLTLRGCREENGIPTFGLCSTVHGEFSPANRKKIVSVVVRLEARIRVKTRSGMLSHTLFSRERPLWRRSDSTSDECPGLLPVSISFPSGYRDKEHGRPHRLPPSMSISHPRRVAIVHSLKVIVRRITCPIFSGTKEMCLSAYLRYSPRVRPPRPSPPTFSSIKVCPEEWQEEIWRMTKVSSSEEKEPLTAQCHLFMPSVGVFASSEVVPFHISFCSSTTFLGSIAQHVTQSNVCLEKPVHVFLLRRTTVSIGEHKNIQDEVLGIGRVSPNPITTVEPVLDNAATQSWDGEIHCERPIEYSSFTTSVIEVKDFFVVSLLAPPGPLESIPPQLYQTFPIRLVTHPWVDGS